MKKIVLVSCGKTKCAHRSKACELYQGNLFKKSFAYAKKLNPDAIYILSAKHGLLELDDEIDPYEKTLNKMGVADRHDWAKQVLHQLRQRADLDKDEFIFLAGDRYREGLLSHIMHCKIPMKDQKSFGSQLKWLKERLDE